MAAADYLIGFGAPLSLLPLCAGLHLFPVDIEGFRIAFTGREEEIRLHSVLFRI